MINERFDRLRSELWEVTQEDWHVNYDQTLTEPVCPIIRIEPDDGSKLPSNGGFIGDTTEKSIDDNICEAIERHLVTLRALKA